MSCFLQDMPEFKTKIDQFYAYKKKLQDLEKRSSFTKCGSVEYLSLIKRCMAYSFLDETEAEFLMYLLEKYEIHLEEQVTKTICVKKEIDTKQKKNKKTQQLTLWDLA